jgi:hypothetical protein
MMSETYETMGASTAVPQPPKPHPKPVPQPRPQPEPSPDPPPTNPIPQVPALVALTASVTIGRTVVLASQSLAWFGSQLPKLGFAIEIHHPPGFLTHGSERCLILACSHTSHARLPRMRPAGGGAAA